MTLPIRKALVASLPNLVGSAFLQRSAHYGGIHQVLTAARSELDLIDDSAVRAWNFEHQPDCSFIAPAMLCGSYSNKTRRVDILHDNCDRAPSKAPPAPTHKTRLARASELPGWDSYTPKRQLPDFNDRVDVDVRPVRKRGGPLVNSGTSEGLTVDAVAAAREGPAASKEAPRRRQHV